MYCVCYLLIQGLAQNAQRLGFLANRVVTGGEHHIATAHVPMVQGGLLTVHPGSIHGGGEAPGGGSSLRQGAGKRAPGAPDLGSAAAAEQRRDREKGLCPRGFRYERDI